MWYICKTRVFTRRQYLHAPRNEQLSERESWETVSFRSNVLNLQPTCRSNHRHSLILTRLLDPRTAVLLIIQQLLCNLCLTCRFIYLSSFVIVAMNRLELDEFVFLKRRFIYRKEFPRKYYLLAFHFIACERRRISGCRLGRETKAGNTSAFAGYPFYIDSQNP